MPHDDLKLLISRLEKILAELKKKEAAGERIPSAPPVAPSPSPLSTDNFYANLGDLGGQIGRALGLAWRKHDEGK